MDETAHNELFSNAVLNLGTIHWTILKSANLLESKRWIHEKNGLVTRSDFSEFGKEVGIDEINWWIFKKEKDTEELKEWTKRALSAAQALRDASRDMRKKDSPYSYDDLVSALRALADQHEEQITSLVKYVTWLEARDALAPSILLTYRVWGSTRISERWIKVDGTLGPDGEKQRIQEAAEIVLGLRNHRSLTYLNAYFDVGFEVYERLSPEEVDPNAELYVPPERVIVRVARIVYEECATYFAEFRDSLREILVDIDKCDEQRNLISSDAFWRDFIVKSTEAMKTETELWDFKETLPIWHVKEQPARDAAKMCFAEDVASFANARGGVLVVGVTDKRKIVGAAKSLRDFVRPLSFC